MEADDGHVFALLDRAEARLQGAGQASRRPSGALPSAVALPALTLPIHRVRQVFPAGGGRAAQARGLLAERAIRQRFAFIELAHQSCTQLFELP